MIRYSSMDEYEQVLTHAKKLKTKCEALENHGKEQEKRHNEEMEKMMQLLEKSKTTVTKE